MIKQNRKSIQLVLHICQAMIVLIMAWSFMGCGGMNGGTNPTSPAMTYRTMTGLPTTLPANTPTVLKQTPQSALCSPLEGIPLNDLGNYVSNPFAPPLSLDARDGGHHGVDFAYYTLPGTGSVMQGSDVYAIFSGQVVSQSSGKDPYGNLVIIETPQSGLPENIRRLLEGFPSPTPDVTERHLSCPGTMELDQPLDFGNPSVYVLYAHLDKAVTIPINTMASCGETIGLVGNSGSSGNPHLHLEIRFGPGHATIGGMGHYSNDATLEEMDQYCEWRISGLFQAIDPMKILGGY